MRRKRRKNKQMKFIMITSLSLLFILTVGYAAFSTNINITAKGNIKEKGITPQELKNKVTTSGDGLYQDTLESGRYIFKGSNPDNYIMFNNELWRIVALEKDNTLKIIKKNKLETMAYDEANARTSAYCNSPSSGCNVWGSDTTMLNANGENITSMPTTIGGTALALPSEESQATKYLNNNYYNSLSETAKSQIDNHLWNVGLLGNVSNQTLETDNALEQKYKWKGNVGLINITDYIKSSLDSNCISVISAYGTGNTQCKNGNYLAQDIAYWTMTPWSNNESFSVWAVYSTGTVAFNRAYIGNSLFPVVFLKSDITLKGKGTESNPYTIN